MCTALFVREMNAELWSPDRTGEACPQMLVDEPVLLDQFETPDGRNWIRVYLDGSALDQNGTVHIHALASAAERRLPIAV